MGLSFDSNNDLWVVCHDGIGFMIFTKNGEFVKEYVSQRNGDGEFISTQGIAVDQSGNIFVSDFYGDRIQIFQENKWFGLPPIFVPVFMLVPQALGRVQQSSWSRVLAVYSIGNCGA